jgi:hypothetical protein
VDSDGGQALQVADSDEPVTFVHNTLGDVAVAARLRFSSGLARLSIRQSQAGSYTALLAASGQVSLYRGSQPLGTAAVPPNAPDGWRTLRLSAVGDVARVSVDGTEVIAVQDAAPLPPGTFSIASVTQNQLTVDDVAVFTRVSSATEEATTEPSLTVTPTETLASTQLPLAFSDDFQGLDRVWVFGLGAGLVPNGDNLALSVSLEDGSYPAALKSVSDAIVEARILPNSSSATRVAFRQGQTQGYVFSIDAQGNAELYKGDTLLQSAIVPNFDGASWHSIHYSVIGGDLIYVLDGVPLFSYSDIDPLPPGLILFYNHVGTTVARSLFDEIRIWAVQEASANLQASANGPKALSFNQATAAGQLPAKTKVLFRTNSYPYNDFNILDDQQNITTIYQARQGISPAVSPNGKMVAFVANDASDHVQNFVMDITGNNVRQVSTNQTAGYSPNWSPDGSNFIVLGASVINVMPLNGTPYQLVDANTLGVTYLQQASWGRTADGRNKIAVSAYPPGQNAIAKIYVFNIVYNTTINQWQLDTSVSPYIVSSAYINYPELEPGTISDSQPVWSPDGNKIAFSRSAQYVHPHDGTYTIYSVNRITVVNADGSGVYDISTSAHDIDWSPDGTQLVYRIETFNQINIVNKLGTGETFLASNPNNNPISGYNPNWFRTVDFTNIDFNGVHTPLKALMFWAIFNETSQDRYYSGSDEEVNAYPLDNNSRTVSSFLIASPYCNSDSTNTAPHENPLDSSLNWKNNIKGLIHCTDHRNVEAQVLINRMLNIERNPLQSGYDANDPADLMQTEFLTFLSGYQGTFKDANYIYWNQTDLQVCISQQSQLPSYAAHLPARKDNVYKNQDFDMGNDNDYYSYYDILKGIRGSTGLRKEAWRWMAVRWLNGVLDCKVYIPSNLFTSPKSMFYNNRIKLSYQRISNQIDTAIREFYQQEPEPTNGAFEIKATNRCIPAPGSDCFRSSKGKTIVDIDLCVGGCSNLGANGAYLLHVDTITSSTDTQYYYHHHNPAFIESCATAANIYAYDDDTNKQDNLDMVRNCYPSDTPTTILQPVLFLVVDLNNPNDPTRAGYKWVTIVYQATTDMRHYPRYSVNVCQINPKIAHCG